MNRITLHTISISVVLVIMAGMIIGCSTNNEAVPHLPVIGEPFLTLPAVSDFDKPDDKLPYHTALVISSGSHGSALLYRKIDDMPFPAGGILNEIRCDQEDTVHCVGEAEEGNVVHIYGHVLRRSARDDAGRPISTRETLRVHLEDEEGQKERHCWYVDVVAVQHAQLIPKVFSVRNEVPDDRKAFAVAPWLAQEDTKFVLRLWGIRAHHFPTGETSDCVEPYMDKHFESAPDDTDGNPWVRVINPSWRSCGSLDGWVKDDSDRWDIVQLKRPLANDDTQLELQVESSGFNCEDSEQNPIISSVLPIARTVGHIRLGEQKQLEEQKQLKLCFQAFESDDSERNIVGAKWELTSKDGLLKCEDTEDCKPVQDENGCFLLSESEPDLKVTACAPEKDQQVCNSEVHSLCLALSNNEVIRSDCNGN